MWWDTMILVDCRGFPRELLRGDGNVVSRNWLLLENNVYPSCWNLTPVSVTGSFSKFFSYLLLYFLCPSLRTAF